MARFDDLTKDFIEKVSGHNLHPSIDDLDVDPQSVSGPRERTLAEKSLSVAKTGIAVVRDPSREIPKLVVKGATKKLLLNAGQPHLEKKAEASTPPLRVYRLLNDLYGDRWWDWEPETIWQTLVNEHGVVADDDLKNLVQVLQVLVNTNQVHEHWHIFENAVNALNGNHVDFTVMQPPTPADIAAAFKVINTVRPEEEFDEEIYTYVAGVCHGEGMVYLPPGLFPKDCQSKLEDITFDRDLEGAVAHCWATQTTSSDERVGIQMTHLKEIKDYVLDQ